MKTLSNYRRHLLSSAGAILAVLVSTPSQAQQANPQATGGTVLVNGQSAGGNILTDASSSGIGIVTGDATDARLTLDANALTATARANRATLTLTPDGRQADPAIGEPLLTTGSGGTAAHAGIAIASSQLANGAQVDADILDSTLRLSAGDAVHSTLGITGNASDTLALANDTGARIEIGGPGAAASGGVASEQIMDSGSDATARSWSGTRLDTFSLAGSNLENSGNLVRSAARGNASDNRLTAAVSSATEGPAVDPAASVSGNGDARVTALFAVLSSQHASGVVRSVAGDRQGNPAFQTVADGPVDASRIVSDGNAVVASAVGNSGTNALDLTANAITTTPASILLPNFAIANVTSVQDSDAEVNAMTLGGTQAGVSDSLSSSMISISSNGSQTAATANLADNSLSLTSPMAGPDALGAHVPGGLTTSQGAMTLWSPIGIQNAQDYRGAVGATHAGTTGIKIRGEQTGSTLRVADNSDMVAATGNSGTSTASVVASEMGAATGINNYQAGSGDVAARAGSEEARSGKFIAGSVIHDGDLSITGNSLTGIATANRATHSLAVSSAEIGSFSGRWANWTAYANAAGAEANSALASTQRLGSAPGAEPGPMTRISSEVFGGAHISASAADHSTLSVESNDQRAEALGNLAFNRIVNQAASLDGHAGAALSSSQIGRADVSAMSEAGFTVRGALTDTGASVSGNSNVALAEINDADNGIAVETASAAGSLDHARVSGAGRAVIGDQVLDNWQEASGTVEATVLSHFSILADAPSGTSLAISGNTSSAEAAANRASNQSSVSSDGAVPVTGLANAQASSATVIASAHTHTGIASDIGFGASSFAVTDNVTSAMARGNVADNRLAASPALGSVPVIASIDGIDGRVEAPAGVLNRQVNSGDVLATADYANHVSALNGVPSISGSNIAINGNSVSAGAYANVATNLITAPGLGQSPSGAIANFQTNSGAVNAFVTQGSFGRSFGSVDGSTLSISGNTVSATAVGNQASSAIAATR